ncbi:hypothetical protein ACRAWF_41605 [Streptomyces sp. L7]
MAEVWSHLLPEWKVFYRAAKYSRRRAPPTAPRSSIPSRRATPGN